MTHGLIRRSLSALLSQVLTLLPTQEATLPEGGDERIGTKRGEWQGPPGVLVGLDHLKAVTAD